MGLVGKVVQANIALSNRLEALVAPLSRADGNARFIEDILPRVLVKDSTIWDVGGGSRPFVSPQQREALGLYVVGLDISAEELTRAPIGSYDETVVHDLCTYEGRGDADHVICTALLEHTPDTAGAMRALGSIVRTDGQVLIFAPSRNALYARLNMLLPETLKRKVLFTMFPEKAYGHDGFKAYYDRCVPRDIEALARANGLVVEERHFFWVSDYFKAFVPAYLMWRAYQWAQRAIIGEQAAETFIYILRKTA